MCARGSNRAWVPGPSTHPLGRTLLRLFRHGGILGLLLLFGACSPDDHGVACHTNGIETDCSIVPPRKSTTEVVRVYIDDTGTCTLNDRALPCADAAKTIRSVHALDNPIVTLCGGKAVTYEKIGLLMSSLSREFPRVQFCSPEHHAVPTSQVQPNNRWRVP